MKTIIYFPPGATLPDVGKLLNTLAYFPSFREYELTFQYGFDRLEEWKHNEIHNTYGNEMYFETMSIEQAPEWEKEKDDFYYFTLTAQHQHDRQIKSLLLSGLSMGAELGFGFVYREMLAYLCEQAKLLQLPAEFISGYQLNEQAILPFIEEVVTWDEVQKEQHGIWHHLV